MPNAGVDLDTPEQLAELTRRFDPGQSDSGPLDGNNKSNLEEK
jgi:hypothetical protein